MCRTALKTSTPVTGTPLAATITSPTSMPAVCAGLPGSTRITFMPVRLPTMIGSAEIPRDRDVAAGAVLVAGGVGAVGALVATDGMSLAGLLSDVTVKSIGTRTGFPVLMSSTSKFFKMPGSCELSELVEPAKCLVVGSDHDVSWL